MSFFRFERCKQSKGNKKIFIRFLLILLLLKVNKCIKYIISETKSEAEEYRDKQRIVCGETTYNQKRLREEPIPNTEHVVADFQDGELVFSGSSSDAEDNSTALVEDGSTDCARIALLSLNNELVASSNAQDENETASTLMAEQQSVGNANDAAQEEQANRLTVTQNENRTEMALADDGSTDGTGISLLNINNQIVAFTDAQDENETALATMAANVSVVQGVADVSVVSADGLEASRNDLGVNTIATGAQSTTADNRNGAVQIHAEIPENQDGAAAAAVKEELETTSTDVQQAQIKVEIPPVVIEPADSRALDFVFNGVVVEEIDDDISIVIEGPIPEPIQYDPHAAVKVGDMLSDNLPFLRNVGFCKHFLTSIHIYLQVFFLFVHYRNLVTAYTGMCTKTKRMKSH